MRNVDQRKTLFFHASIAYVLLFSLAVSVPYYFLGYADLVSPGPGPGLGYTGLPIVNVISYLLSFQAIGGVMLTLSIIGLAICGGAGPEIQRWRWISRLLVLLAAFYCLDFHKYANTINCVLE